MKDLVVCIADMWGYEERNEPVGHGVHPVKGEIYEVTGVHKSDAGTDQYFYSLKGFENQYNTKDFRPTDNSFGEATEWKIRELVKKEDEETISV